MPEFTHADRNMIEAENTLWHVCQMLEEIESAGVWDETIKEARNLLATCAKDMRKYNDQFEEG